MTTRDTTPATADARDEARVSPSQRRILDMMKRRGACTIPELATGIQLNIETVRHHLRALGVHGFVEARSTRSSGPGRPQVVYALTSAAEQLFPRREGEILQALARHLKETGNERLIADFFESWIGSRREEALARVANLAGDERLEEVARILTELGFMAHAEPRTGAARTQSRIHLCHCPLRELVEVTRIPCRAELSFIRELMGEPLTRLAYIPSGDASCSYRARSA